MKQRHHKPEGIDEEFKNLTLFKNMLAWDAMLEISKTHRMPVDQLFFEFSSINQHLILDSLNEDLKRPTVTVKRIVTD